MKNELYTPNERFDWFSEQMERAFEQQHFDVFKQLSAERFRLLRLVEDPEERDQLISRCRVDLKSWVQRINESMRRNKADRARWQKATGRTNRPARSGRLINQVG